MFHYNGCQSNEQQRIIFLKNYFTVFLCSEASGDKSVVVLEHVFVAPHSHSDVAQLTVDTLASAVVSSRPKSG